MLYFAAQCTIAHNLSPSLLLYNAACVCQATLPTHFYLRDTCGNARTLLFTPEYTVLVYWSIQYYWKVLVYWSIQCYWSVFIPEYTVLVYWSIQCYWTEEL